MSNQLTQEVIIFLNQQPQEVDYTVSGGFTLNMADGWVLKELVAAAGHTAKKKEMCVFYIFDYGKTWMKSYQKPTISSRQGFEFIRSIRYTQCMLKAEVSAARSVVSVKLPHKCLLTNNLLNILTEDHKTSGK